MPVTIDAQHAAKLGIMESVLRSVMVGAIVLDRQQRIVLWNRWLEQHARFNAELSTGQDFIEAFPEMANGRTHAAIREALDNNFTSLISQTLNKAPFRLYDTAADATTDQRIQQAVQVIPIEVENLPRHCLIQIIDVSKAVMRERLLREQSAALKTMSYTDGLTGIANRRQFDERINEEYARARRSKTPLSLLMIDIDFFKLYNDNYGHQQGDKCLREVASVLADVLHRPADLVARYGGEEFAAILPDTDAKGAQFIAETMRSEIEKRAFDHQHSTIANYVSVSIGIATFSTAQYGDVNKFMEAADRGLYEAKNSGRNRIFTSPGSPAGLTKK